MKVAYEAQKKEIKKQLKARYYEIKNQLYLDCKGYISRSNGYLCDYTKLSLDDMELIAAYLEVGGEFAASTAKDDFLKVYNEKIKEEKIMTNNARKKEILSQETTMNPIDNMYGDKEESKEESKELEELRAKLESAKQSCDYWRKDSGKNHDALMAEREKTNELVTKLEKAQKEKEESCKNRESAQTLCNQYYAAYNDEVKKNDNYKAQLETANKVITESRDRYDALTRTNLILNETIDKLTEEKERLQKTIDSMKWDMEQVTANNKMLQGTIDILKSESEARRKRIIELEGHELVKIDAVTNQKLVDDLAARVEKMENFFRNNEGWV